MDKQQTENMNKLTTNMEQLTSSIADGFAMLRQVMLQPYGMPPQYPSNPGYQGMYQAMPGIHHQQRNAENSQHNGQYSQFHQEHYN